MGKPKASRGAAPAAAPSGKPEFEAWTPDSGGADIEAWDPDDPFDPSGEPNILDENEPTGEIETDDAAESKTVLRVLAETNRAIHDNVKMGYYLHVVFMTERQATEFTEKLKGVEVVDNIVLDGIELARALGIELTPATLTLHGERPDARLIAEVGANPIRPDEKE